MKDHSKAALELYRPKISAIEAIDFCLNMLYEDDEHTVEDLVCFGLSYEEIIGALLLAKDAVE